MRRICRCGWRWRTVGLWAKQYPCVLDTYHEILMLNAESAEADMLGWRGVRRDEGHSWAPFSSFVLQKRRIPRNRMCTTAWAICCGYRSNTPRRQASSEAELKENIQTTHRP